MKRIFSAIAGLFLSAMSASAAVIVSDEIEITDVTYDYDVVNTGTKLFNGHFSFVVHAPGTDYVISQKTRSHYYSENDERVFFSLSRKVNLNENTYKALVEYDGIDWGTLFRILVVTGDAQILSRTINSTDYLSDEDKALINAGVESTVIPIDCALRVSGNFLLIESESVSRIEIFNLTGCQLLDRTLTGTTQIDISELTSRFLICRVTFSDGRSYVSKITH